MPNMHVQLNFAVELDADLLASLLLHKAIVAHPELSASEVGTEPPSPAATPEPPPPAAPLERPPRSARAARAARVNGAAAVAEVAPSVEAPIEAAAAPPAIPTEADVRALLTRVAAIHPNKVKGVTDLLESHGGSPRLLACPVETWPAIVTALNDAIAAAGG